MPLPTPGSHWPPRPLVPAFDAYREYDAWYAGDTATLQYIYSTDARPTHVHNGEYRVGGLFNGVAAGMSRMFWGKRWNPSTKRTALHVPLAADVASMKSDMLWAEPATFSLVDDLPEVVQERLDVIMNGPDAHMMLNEAGEVCSALGGTYYSLAWNRSGPIDHVYVRAHDADTAIPEWGANRLTAVTFWTTYVQSDKLYRHLERHEPGAIIHALYLGEADNVGIPVPLETLEETRWLTQADPGRVSDGLMVTMPTGIDRLTAAYQPNVKKGRKFRRAGTLSLLGRSDYEGVTAELNAVDEAWSSYMRDLKVARSRIFIDDDMLTSRGVGKGAFWDEEQEVFATLKSLGVNDKEKITAQQFQIRAAEHEQMILALSKVCLRNAGLGSRDYEEQSGNVTATGELMREKREETTFDKQKRYATAATTYIASVGLELDGVVFPGRGGQPGVQVGAEFPHDQQIDAQKEAQIISLLSAAKAISTDTMVRRANPDWSDDQVDVEVAKIQNEAPSLPDPATFGRPDEDEAA